ncbi:CBF/Mak21 family-domain-containing protein [Schizophyllum commune]
MARAGKNFTTKPSKKGKHDKKPKDQVLALGGTEGDYDLVKDADKEPTAGKGTAEDPALSREVSKFLKGLKSGGAVDDDADDDPSPPKYTKKNKKDKTRKAAESAPSSSTSEPKSHKKDDKPQGKHAKGKETKPDGKQRKGKETEKAAESPALEPPKPRVVLPEKVTVSGKFAIPPTSHWYSILEPLGPAPNAPSPSDLAALASNAARLHEADVAAYRASSASNSASEAHFLSNIIQSGTLSDRLSALTLLVQSSPLHNTQALETLKGMGERGKGKGGREESLKALRSVVDWWVGGGAPGRKLKYFRDQPLMHQDVTDEHLIVWHFEDWLKKYFFSILQILEALSLDTLSYVRLQALNLITTLLREKPEQEQNLLRLLVNKLGDPERTVCSRASYHILQLLQQHPSMKGVVVREVINLVMRPATAPAPAAPASGSSSGKHLRFDAPSSAKSKSAAHAPKTAGNPHARYYAAITCNQIVLAPNDRDVVHALVNFYFDMFKELLGEKPEGDGDAPSESGTPAPELDKHGRVKDKNALKKKKGGALAKDKKGKGKMAAGAAGFAEVEDAQSKLISAILTGVNRALPFARLDSADAALNKHIDTLFFITHKSTFNISLQALVLIQQIAASLGMHQASSAAAKAIIDRYYRTLYASLHDARLASSAKQAMYLNLLFKSLKADSSAERVKAMVKRLVQLLAAGGNGATEFVAGGLYLLGQLFDSVPGLRSMVTDPPPASATESYDARKRDPLFAHASASLLYELLPLTHHYHPAVALHARQLLAGQPLTASADLSQNTLTHFLDRFVYKNPKKLKADDNVAVSGKARGASAMQPAASGVDGTAVKLMRGEVPGVAPLVTDAAFLRKREEEVPVDEVFFHRYLTRKQKGKAQADDDEPEESAEEDAGEVESGKSDAEDSDEEDDNGPFIDLSDDEQTEAPKKAAEEKDEDEDDDETDDEEEAEIWKAMKASMPKAGDDDDLDLMDDSDESDDVPSGLDGEDSDEVPSGLDSGEDEDAAASAASESDDGEDDGDAASDADDLSLAEASDDDDLMPLDDAFGPDGVLEYDGSDASGEEDEWQGFSDDKKKRKRDAEGGEKRKKKKQRLPTFASYEDYAKMIEDTPEDNI